MTFKEKLSLFQRHPNVVTSYGKWLLFRSLGRKPLRKTSASGGLVKIGGWISFSEYWSFSTLIPREEKHLLQGILDLPRDYAPVALDIGANIGIFTCWLAANGCRVHAFEPISETFCRLGDNVRRNDLGRNVSLNCFALGSDNGLVAFSVQENSPATNRVASQQTDSARVVPVVSLDAYANKTDLQRIHFAKVDVEGMEPLVVQGARRLLTEKRIDALMVEICPFNLVQAGFSVADLVNAFESVGYAAESIEPGGSPGRKLTLSELQQMTLQNVLFKASAR